MKPITVLLAEVRVLFRDGIKALLDSEEDMRVVAEASDGREAVVLATTHRPDVVLIGASMPRLNSLSAIQQILRTRPNTCVIVLASDDDRQPLERFIGTGAKGFLRQHESAIILRETIREAIDGAKCVSRSAADPGLLRSRVSTTLAKAAQATPRALTPREREVVQLIAEGRANKHVAAELGISIKTAQKHRQHLMAKLKIHETAGLTRYAIAAGLVDSGARQALG